MTRQAVELATAVSRSFVQDVNSDGLLGLAFSKINTVRPTQQKTFFDNIKADLALPVFTADLKRAETGSYEFGAIDTSKFTGELTYIPIDNSRGFWEFASSRFSVNGKMQSNPNPTTAIADTGTSLMLVDEPVAEAYYRQVRGAVNDPNIGGFVYPCSSVLPDFGVAIGNDYMAVIPGDGITFAQVDAQSESDRTISSDGRITDGDFSLLRWHPIQRRSAAADLRGCHVQGAVCRLRRRPERRRIRPSQLRWKDPARSDVVRSRWVKGPRLSCLSFWQHQAETHVHGPRTGMRRRRDEAALGGDRECLTFISLSIIETAFEYMMFRYRMNILPSDSFIYATVCAPGTEYISNGA